MTGLVHVTKRMRGKMLDMISINTSPMWNDYCNAMAKKPDSICGSCFSRKSMKIYKNSDSCFKRNGELLSDTLLEDWQVPRLNALTVRFSAHGELINGTHLANLFAIARANPKVTCTLWTKRKDLVSKVIRDFGRPDNLILVYSSPRLNKQEKLPAHFDKTFTVYTKDSAPDDINCGSKKCKDCMTCYTQGNTTTHIKELLK